MVMKRTCSSAFSVKLPLNWVVTVERAAACSTPRTDMQVCSASIITATPRG